MKALSSILPGPTDEAKVLQDKQWKAYCELANAIYETRILHPGIDEATVRKQPAYVEKKVAYQETVEALKALLGDNAHCAEVDTGTWRRFLNYCRQELGKQNYASHITVEQAKEALTQANFEQHI